MLYNVLGSKLENQVIIWQEKRNYPLRTKKKKEEEEWTTKTEILLIKLITKEELMESNRHLVHAEG